MKASILPILLFFLTLLNAQNKQVLYNFDQLPQTLLLNPGEKVFQQWHAGVPLLSSFSLFVGSSDVTIYDVFADDGTTINDKVRNIIYDLSSKDFGSLNQQLELVNVGIRIKNNRYFLSFGFYQEFDAVGYYPKDMVMLFYEGNSTLNKLYALNQINFKAELLGVLHAGISRKIDEDLQIGARLKLYSGVMNVQSRNNKGVFYTQLGNLNQYEHILGGIDGKFNTSGVFLPAGTDIDRAYFQKKLLMGGNLGLGVDVGFTYQPQQQWTVSGSILDLGFIHNTKDTRTYKVQGNYSFQGIEPNFDLTNPTYYWEDLEDDFLAAVNYEKSNESYISWRSAKLNGMVKYEFGEDRFTDCFDTETEPGYFNAVGAHLFTIFRPIAPQIAATVFYERKFSNGLRAKVTYTADSYSLSNIGLGISARFGVFNMYAVADQFLGYQNLAKTNAASIQFGMNIIVK